MGKIRKFPLNLQSNNTGYGLGILTDEPGYRLCWLLNRCLSWDLAKSGDITIKDKNSPAIQSFAHYASPSGHQPSVSLISNRSGEGLWLTAYQQVDFLLVVAGWDQDGSELDELKMTIGLKVPEIRGLFKVPLPSFCYL